MHGRDHQWCEVRNAEARRKAFYGSLKQWKIVFVKAMDGERLQISCRAIMVRRYPGEDDGHCIYAVSRFDANVPEAGKDIENPVWLFEALECSIFEDQALQSMREGGQVLLDLGRLFRWNESKVDLSKGQRSQLKIKTGERRESADKCLCNWITRW